MAVQPGRLKGEEGKMEFEACAGICRWGFGGWAGRGGYGVGVGYILWEM